MCNLFHLFFDVTFVAALDLDLVADFFCERGQVGQCRAEAVVGDFRALQQVIRRRGAVDGGDAGFFERGVLGGARRERRYR